jgi:hypothetical protein
MKMKNYIIKILASVAMVLLLGACKYLDVVPDNVAVIENAFADTYNAEKFLATCYSYLPVFSDPWINPGLLAGDEVWLNEEVSNGYVEAALIAKGFQNTRDPFLNYWDGGGRGTRMFVGIRDCNIFLENLKYVVDLSDVQRRKWIAEVNFLKAFYHFWLFRCYGPIPIIDENLPIYASTDEVKTYREPVDKVVEYIVSTIDKAVPDLPLKLSSETTEFGRITRPIALSVKALVLATAASPLYNGNPDFASLVDNRGIALFNSVYDQEKWKKAADASLAAIQACNEAGIILFNDVTTRNVHSDNILLEFKLRSIVTTKGSPEIIWPATNFTFSQGYQSMLQPLLVNVTNANPVTQHYSSTLQMAELFYSKNGVPIEEDKSFDYPNRYELRTAVTEDNDFVKSGQQTAILHFDREARFYADIAFDRGTYVLDPTYYYTQVRAGELATKRNQGEFSATGYFVKKFISPNNAFSGNSYVIDYAFPFPIIRLADLFLLYAETLNETKDAPDADVYQYIDLVRERAGLKGVVESWQNFSSDPTKPYTKSGMREIIQHERMIELAFEGPRFWDLRRWKLSGEYMNRPIKGWNISGRGTEFYKVVTIYTPQFDFKDYFWPIKEDELIKNPNLVQNLGW